MADNITLDSGTGGAVVKTDDDGTAHWQYVKVSFGPDNTQTRVTASVGLPVDLLAGTAEIGNVKNAGTFVIQEDGAALTALQLIDDVVATLGTTTYTEATTKGNVIGAVRNDTLAALAGTDNEIAPLQVNASGALYIQEGSALDVSAATLTVNAHAVTNAGTFVVQEDGAALTALQVIDNIVHVDDAAFTLGTDAGVMMMGFAGTQSVDANDVGALAMETDGALHIHDGGNAITVDWAGTAPPIGAGTEATALRVTVATDSTGVLSVDDNGGSLTVDNGGTFATQATLQTGSNTVGEVTIGLATTAATDLAKAQDVAVGASDVGMAMLVKRDDEQAAVTPVDGDYVVPTCDRFGKLKITELPDATSEVKYVIIDAASSGDNTIQAAAGAGIKIRVLSVLLVSAGTVTTRFESAAGGTALTGQMNLVANSGFTLPYNPHGWFETADNALLNLELSGAISVDGCITYVEV